MCKNIEFLKELQEELKSQEKDCQASPRFWTIGDYEMVPTLEGCHDGYYIDIPKDAYYGSLDEWLQNTKENELDEFSDDVVSEFNNIACEVSAMNWIKENCDDDAEIIPVEEKHIIHRNTMFLTKAEAKEHLRLNNYHYSKKAHTYAMTAWRAPKVERLLDILENFDWDKI